MYIGCIFLIVLFLFYTLKGIDVWCDLKTNNDKNSYGSELPPFRIIWLWPIMNWKNK